MLQSASAAEVGASGGADRTFRDSRLTVRIRPDDQLLLRERAAAWGMGAATYVSVLTRMGFVGMQSHDIAVLKCKLLSGEIPPPPGPPAMRASGYMSGKPRSGNGESSEEDPAANRSSVDMHKPADASEEIQPLFMIALFSNGEITWGPHAVSAQLHDGMNACFGSRNFTSNVS
jgi:hypothetical protein